MGFIKSYFAPGKDKASKKQSEPMITEKAVAPAEATGTSPTTRYPSALNTPGNGATPWGSRPASIYPTGDFRNNDRDDLRDIKCDVMANWLYQQQMETLWTAGAPDEGVVLKKTRGSYTCCPADLVEEPYGFYRAIETLNVRVSIVTIIIEKACD